MEKRIAKLEKKVAELEKLKKENKEMKKLISKRDERREKRKKRKEKEKEKIAKDPNYQNAIEHLRDGMKKIKELQKTEEFDVKKYKSNLMKEFHKLKKGEEI